jgi:ADP-heptose:LPS heptosyltransferase
MSAVLLTALIALLAIGFPFVAILGWGHNKSREHLRNAAVAAGNKQFPAARQYVLIATRLHPLLKSSPVLVEFYDLILAQADITPETAQKIKDLADHWPKSRFELLWANDLFKVAFFALIALGFVVRFLSLQQ